MGSTSDWETMQHAAATLEALGVPFEKRVVSAHRTPKLMVSYAESAEKRGLKDVLLNGLRRTKVAAVGPLVAEALRSHGIAADVCPEQGFQMKNLVRQLVRALS